MNNTTNTEALETGVVLCTIFTSACIVWIIFGNALTLVAVSRARIERQKKQIISVLIADIYNGIVGLPTSVLQLNDLKIFENQLACVLSFGVADFGALIIGTSTAVLTVTTLLNLKFPFKSDTFMKWENCIFVIQWVFPLCFTGALNFGLSRGVREVDESCDWSDLPKWYLFLFGGTLFSVISVSFGFAGAILCIARKQVVAITSIELAVNARLSARSQSAKMKHRRLAKLILTTFSLTWIPLTVALSLVFYDTKFGLDDEIFFFVYVFILSVVASVPVFYSYTFSGVRPQLMMILRTMKVWK